MMKCRGDQMVQYGGCGHYVAVVAMKCIQPQFKTMYVSQKIISEIKPEMLED
jgi:hypothetical protein